MKVYLDIDGVLLANEENPALHAEELIHYLTENYEVYWLTTHCRGDAVHTQQHIARHFPKQITLRALGKIQATNWDTWKTEAIDFSQPFYWIDDDLFDEEERELVARGARGRFINVDLRQNPAQLLDIIQLLRQGRSDA